MKNNNTTRPGGFAPPQRADLRGSVRRCEFPRIVMHENPYKRAQQRIERPRSEGRW